MTTTEENEDMAARLEALVKSGVYLKDAIRQLDCWHWFYRYAPDECRRRVKQAHIEQLRQASIENSTGIGIINIHLPVEKKKAFQDLCTANGMSLQRRASMLITQDINSNTRNSVA